jgi:hypothetical protein
MEWDFGTLPMIERSKTNSCTKIIYNSINTRVATLALGSRPRQRGYKGAGQEEARESHQRLPGV